MPKIAAIQGVSHLATSTIGNVPDELGVGGMIVGLKPLVSGRPFVGAAVGRDVPGTRISLLVLV